MQSPHNGLPPANGHPSRHVPQVPPLRFGSDPTAALRRLAALEVDDVVTDTLAVARVPAPTGHEGERARLVRDLFSRDDPGRLVYIDPAGNVVTRIAGSRRERSVMVAAHLDTVFGTAVPHDCWRDGDRLIGPGVGDNAVAVAALLALPRLMARAGMVPACDVVLVGTVGEEGYGNLRGMAAALDMHRETGAVIAVEGHGIGRITHVAVGSRRLAIHLSGPGGHSWADHGRPSAVHVVGELIARLAAIVTPEWPRTTLNVGSVSGGDAINSIASSATIQVEVRSMDVGALEALLDEVFRQARAVERDGLRIVVETLGVRPGGSLPADHLIVRRARSALAAVGTPSASDASSTDANVPLAAGIPAVCVGVSRGGRAHTPAEWLDIEPIGDGLAQLALLTRSVAADIESGMLRRTAWPLDGDRPMAAASD